MESWSLVMSGRLAVAYENVDASKNNFLTADSIQMRLLFCACNLYWNVTNNFCKIALPYNDYLRNDRKLVWLDPITEAPDAFNSFKSKFMEPPVLAPL